MKAYSQPSWLLFWLLVLCLQTSASPRMKVLKSRAAPNDALVQQWQDASWIWLSDGLDLQVPLGDWAFRTTYSPRSGVAAVTVNVLITADDYFTLFINGQQIGGTRSPANNGKTVWAAAQGYSITLNAQEGAPVVFAVLATNGGNPPGTAAGLLVAVQLTLSDGSTASVSTGRDGWRGTQNIPQNFEAADIDDSGWSSTVNIEKNGGDAPWGAVVLPSDLTNIALRASAPPPSPNTSPITPSTSAPGPNAPSTQTTTRGIVTSVMTITGANGSVRTSTSTGTSPGTEASVGNGATSIVPLATTAVTTVQSPNSTIILGGPSTSVAAISSASSTPVGAIAGGTVGGIFVLLLLVIACLLYLRRRKRVNQERAAPLSAFSDDEMRTDATVSPFSGPSPSSTSSPPPSHFPNQHVEPFVLQARGHDVLRSKLHYDEATKTPALSDSVAGHERSSSSGSGATRTAGELGVTMNKLHELAEELNRGLAERGEDTPRLMVVSGRNAQWLNAQSANGSVYDHGRDSVPLPPYEGRQDS